LSHHGLDVTRFVGELFSISESAFFAWNVVILALAVLAPAFLIPRLPACSASPLARERC
jgi:hypothetical protein